MNAQVGVSGDIGGTYPINRPSPDLSVNFGLKKVETTKELATFRMKGISETRPVIFSN